MPRHRLLPWPRACHLALLQLCCRFSGGDRDRLWAAFNMPGLIVRDLEIMPKQALKDTLKIYKNMIMNIIIIACK